MSSATWTGHIIGLENPSARRLKNIVGQTQGLPRSFFSLHNDRVANAIAQQRSDIHGGIQQGWEEGTTLLGVGLNRVECVFQQYWMLRIDSRSHQAESGDHWHVYTIGNGDDLRRLGLGIQFFHGSFVTGIDGDHGGIFENNFRFEVAQLVDFMGNGVPFFRVVKTRTVSSPPSRCP